MSPRNAELSAEEYGSEEVADVVHEEEDDELLISSQIWTRAEEGILKESIPIYRKTQYRHKGTFVEKKVVRRIKKLEIKLHGAAAFEKGGEKYDDWKLKKARIYKYMDNHGRIERGVKLPGMNKKWTFIAVLRELRRTDILQEAKDLAQSAMGDEAAWLGYYQQARKNVQQALNRSERKAIEELVVKWNDGDIPPAVQQRNAKANANKTIKEITRRNFVNMGMRCLFVECHMDLDGMMVVSFNDTASLKIDLPEIPSFREFNPTAMAYLVKEYKLYAKKVHKILTEGTAPPGKTMEHVGLIYHPRGLPMVPAEVLNNRKTETCLVQKRLIRLYLNKHYELAGGKGAAPYSRMMTLISKGVEMFAAEYWPPGVPLKEPSDYRTAQSNAILRHWRKRERQGQIPFKFSSIISGGEPTSADYPDELFELEPPPSTSKGGRRTFKQRRNKRSRDTSDSDSENIKSNGDSIDLESEDEDVEQPPESQEPTPSLGGDDIQQPDGSDQSDGATQATPPPLGNETEGSPTLPPDSDRDEKTFGGGVDVAEPPTSDVSDRNLPVANPPATTQRASSKHNEAIRGHRDEKGKGKAKAVKAAAVPRQTRAQMAKQAPPTKGTRSQTKAKK